MTTKVTIDAHAGWDISYTTVNIDSAGVELSRVTGVVTKYTTKDIYIHSNMKLVEIVELQPS